MGGVSTIGLGIMLTLHDASSDAWVVVRGYEKSVRVATDCVLSAHGSFRDVAQKNGKIRRNSLLFHILCMVEATEMLQL